jgi:hypothetical protein
MDADTSKVQQLLLEEQSRQISERTKVESTPHNYPEPAVAQAASSSAKTAVR